MQTFRRGVVAFFAVMMVAGSAPSFAGKAVSFSSPVEAYRQGMSDFRAGKLGSAMPALEFAAQEGVLGAQLQLAQIYAKGKKIKKNHTKAFFYYQNVTDRFADLNSKHPASKYVARAFVALAKYYERGMPGTLAANENKALDLYRYAASYFRYPSAQFHLARLYLSGNKIERNIPVAAKWLNRAAKKDHAVSQALLGHLLWTGEGIKKRPVKALALLTLARMNAHDLVRTNIENLYQHTIKQAEPEQQATAEKLISELQVELGASKKKFLASRVLQLMIAGGKSDKAVVKTPAIAEAKEDLKTVPGIQQKPTYRPAGGALESFDFSGKFRNVETELP